MILPKPEFMVEIQAYFNESCFFRGYKKLEGTLEKMCSPKDVKQLRKSKKSAFLCLIRVLIDPF